MRRGSRQSSSIEADAILGDRDIPVLPDVLTNAGGVTVSYFEWVQDLGRLFWTRDEIRARLAEKLNDAFDRVWDLAQEKDVSLREAKAGKLTGAGYHTYVMTGDGEMQEGSNWEAIMAASQFNLDNLTLIVDHNRFQQGAALADTNSVAPLRPKLEAFGWEVSEINGNEMAQIVPALEHRSTRPHCIVAHTNKGHGISFMQDRVDWHHKVPNKEQYEQAVAELSEAL